MCLFGEFVVGLSSPGCMPLGIKKLLSGWPKLSNRIITILHSQGFLGCLLGNVPNPLPCTSCSCHTATLQPNHSKRSTKPFPATTGAACMRALWFGCMYVLCVYIHGAAQMLFAVWLFAGLWLARNEGMDPYNLYSNPL